MVKLQAKKIALNPKSVFLSNLKYSSKMNSVTNLNRGNAIPAESN